MTTKTTYIPLEIDTLSPYFSDSHTGIFLDSSRCCKDNRHSFLFLDPIEELWTHEYTEVEKILTCLDEHQKRKWICGYLTYEASYAFEETFKQLRIAKTNRFPLLWFGVFTSPLIFDHRNGTWNRELPPVPFKTYPHSPHPTMPVLTHKQGEKKFKKNIQTIRNQIMAGETYQVNYTYDVSLKSDLLPFDLYTLLRKNQQTPYCAFIQNRFGCISSFSPELFFSKQNRRIKVKPMKGTAPRGNSLQEDTAISTFLQNDSKNRAENLMIVDLLRNDLGKICKTGTVKTEKLFEIETHATIHQMTSTITGTLKPSIHFSHLIKGLFPCGSVTGAPKISTMEIIHSIEDGYRGVYCGAIGFTSPTGNAKFNVPIRTLQKRICETDWRYRVGSGIIWDSKAEEEWKECKDKCKFLDTFIPDFQLVETLFFKRKYLYENEHIIRMQASAQYFQYPFSYNNLHNFIHTIKNNLKDNEEYLVRLLLNKKGSLSFQTKTLQPNSSHSNTILFSDITVNEENIFLFHKTNYRPWYDKTMEKIRANQCFDCIYCNSKGQVTEGARSTIFIEKNDTMYTPPVSCGLLPGILRKHLLQENRCQEKILYPQDILTADRIYCGNSVRGLNLVHLNR